MVFEPDVASLLQVADFVPADFAGAAIDYARLPAAFKPPEFLYAAMASHAAGIKTSAIE